MIARMLSLLLLAAFRLKSAAADENLVWGVSAIALPSAGHGEPQADSLLASHAKVAVLDRFFRLGGENAPVTPTECRVAWKTDA